MYEQLVLSVIDVMFNNVASMTVSAVCIIMLIIILLKK